MGIIEKFWAGFNSGQILEMLIRLILAAILGGIVGIERSRRFKDAGVRTHSVVACAASLMMMISKYGFLDILGRAGIGNTDPARIAAGVVTGVSFLGAGIIFRDKQQHSIKGLTTAAGIWCVAGIGMAAGAGVYFLAVFATIFVVILQFLMHKIQIGNDRYNNARMQVVINDDPDAVKRMDKRLKDWGILISDTLVTRDDDTLCYDLDIKAPSREVQKKIDLVMTEDKDVVSVRLRDII
jgi:putative Mg2+ transporter-C (MgtC) family protein